MLRTVFLMLRYVWLAVAFVIFSAPALSASLDAQAINDAQWSEKTITQGAVSPVMVKLQVLLDRAHFSPGEIDGKSGENVDKAIAGYAIAQGEPADSGMSADLWRSLSEAFNEPAIVEYKISEADVRGPFTDKIPAKMEDMKDLEALSYRSAKEKSRRPLAYSKSHRL